MANEPTTSQNPKAGDPTRRNQRVAAATFAVAFGMLGMAYAAVPLYRMFCEATGYAGTTQRAVKPSQTVLDRKITVRFDANVTGGLPWTFEPAVPKTEIRIGETTLAIYRATNNSNRTTVGSAVFNVSPDVSGAYFNKLECFCFTEQRLEPGQTAELPVSFFVDPGLMSDKDGRLVTEITLSYTFHPVANPQQATAPSTVSTPGGG